MTLQLWTDSPKQCLPEIEIKHKEMNKISQIELIAKIPIRKKSLYQMFEPLLNQFFNIPYFLYIRSVKFTFYRCYFH